MRTLILFLFCFLQQIVFAQPKITSFSPASGPVGTTVVITGEGFSDNPNDNIVFFGAVRGMVTAASATSLSVTVPVSASYDRISVISLGLIGYSKQPFIITFPGGGQITSSSFITPYTDRNLSLSLPYPQLYGTTRLNFKDINNDGKPDVVAQASSNHLYVIKNTSVPTKPSIAEPVVITEYNNYSLYGVQDINLDGKVDILGFKDYVGPKVFFNSSSDSSIKIDTPVSIPARGIYYDLDGDGLPDFVSGGTNSSGSGGTLYITRNTSSGGIMSFAPTVEIVTYKISSLAVGYINDDNKPDLVTISDNSIRVYTNTSTIGNISFNDVSLPFTASGPTGGLAIADFDGDNKTDVATWGSSTVTSPSGTVYVFRNNGGGQGISFETEKKIYTGVGAYCNDLKIGDLNGDGKPDITVTHGGRFPVLSIFRNSSPVGTVSFDSPFNTGISEAFNNLNLADIDNDGRLDMCVGYSHYGSIDVFRNIVGQVPIIASFSPTSVCSNTAITINGEYFNGATAVSFGGVAASSFTVVSDTVITAVPAGGASGDVAVTTSNGTGSKSGFSYSPCVSSPKINSFTPISGPAGTLVTIKGQNFSITPSDNTVYFGAVKAIVSSATDTSLVVAVPAGATNQPITVTANNRTAYSPYSFNLTFSGVESCDEFSASSFATRRNFATGASPFSSTIIDIDINGKPDVVTANSTANNISVLRNVSAIRNSSFATQAQTAAGLQTINTAYGDFDGDGKQDVVAVNSSSSSVSVFRNTSSMGNPSFATKMDFATGTGPRGIYVNDVDADGKPDIVATNIVANTVSVLRNTSTAAGEISFADQVTFATGNGPYGVFVLDIDADSKPDIAVANSQSTTVSVLKNTSTSGMIAFAAKQDFAVGSQPTGIFISDINGDGKMDIVVSNSASSAVSVLTNTSASGNIGFAGKQDFATGSNPFSIAVADLNGDGRPDIGTANAYDNTVSVLKNTSTAGSISFANKSDYSTGNNPRSIVIGDIDGDAIPDIIAANNNDNTISVLQNKLGIAPGQICAGGSTSITAGLEGTNYQWQLNTGSGFADISDNSNYTGTDTSVLTLNNIPSSWYGYQFRTIVDGMISDTITLTFANRFLGSIDNTWENPGNWSCNQLPDGNTDVIISCSKNVLLKSNGTCRSVISKAGSSVIVESGFTLNITH